MSARRATLVEQVREELLAQIIGGKYTRGDRLPNEQEMSEQFAVSRATMREAYSGLIDMGYLVRRHGRGTFVSRAPLRHALDLNLSYTSLIKAAGFEASIRVLSQHEEEAADEDRERLSLDEGELVLRVERIRYADDRPVVYSIDRVPLDVVPLAERSDVQPSLFSMFSASGHGVRNGRAKLRPVLAGKAEAMHLQVEEGAPLLRFDEVDYDQEGRAILASTEWHTTDVFEMWINRRAVGSME